jgi:ubiquitin-conjugating enzyme E2 variant
MSQATTLRPDLAPGAGARTPAFQEYVGVYAFFIVCGLIVRHLAVPDLAVAPWVLIIPAALGFLASDFACGLVHWGFDTWGSPTTPFLGVTFIIPFRVHHSDSKEITRHGFVATNGHNCLAATPVLAASLLMPSNQVWGALTITALLSFCLGVFATNQFHKWAHEDKVSPLINFLQRNGIILGKEHHSIHHAAPYLTHYCITTGWMNPLLARIDFFRHVEHVITAVTGVEPRIDDLKPDEDLKKAA